MITQGEWKPDLETGEVTAFDDAGGETPIVMARDDVADFMEADELASNLKAIAAVPRMVALMRDLATRDDRPGYLPKVQALLTELA